MKTKLFWIITPYDNGSRSLGELRDIIEIEAMVGARVKPTKKSAMKLAEKLAKELDYPMEIYWKKGRKSWKHCMIYEND